MTDRKRHNYGQDDLEVVIGAGEILMESGAEIYRIEETMKYMASTLELEHFATYVVNREIIASAINHMGLREAKVTSVPETSVHLGKIEKVNSLSREIELEEEISCQEIASRLDQIRRMPDSAFWTVLLCYFIGAGCFSYAIGSSLVDSFSSAITGLAMGLVFHLANKYIRTTVLLTIIESATVTIMANLLYLGGLGQHRGLIILGTLMLIVPGATFTNSVREFSQNNHATGVTLLMSALLICISIAVGVVLATELLPFVEQMSSTFSNHVDSWWELAARTIMAGVGTVAFSVLFHAPRRYFLDLGILGGGSWLLYLLLSIRYHQDIPAIFISATFAALGSRFLSVKKKCPITIFLSTSIFPLLPGLSFYRSVYFLMTGAPALAWTYLRSCFISAFAIALAIIIIQEIRFHRPDR